jgi:hypothetical protein
MSEPLAAPELDDRLFAAVRDELRACTDANEVDLTSATVDIIRAIVHAGFEIRRC